MFYNVKKCAHEFDLPKIILLSKLNSFHFVKSHLRGLGDCHQPNQSNIIDFIVHKCKLKIYKIT